MEMIAVSLGFVGLAAVAAWWDIERKRSDTSALEARLAKLEENDRNNRNNINGLKDFANADRKKWGR